MNAWFLRSVNAHQGYMFESDMESQVQSTICTIAAGNFILIFAKAEMCGPAPRPPLGRIRIFWLRAALSHTTEAQNAVSDLTFFNIG